MSIVPSSFSRQDRCNLQKALNEKTKSALYIDGDIGAKSVVALKKFQIQSSLPASGEYDSATYAVLNPFIEQKYVVEADFQRGATELGLEVSTLKAFVEVEAQGAGFLDDGRCLILFERHKFYQQLSRRFPADKVTLMAAKNPDIINKDSGGYLGEEREYPRLDRAIAIDREAALLSASWGLGQVMGFNFAVVGWTSIESFVADMQQSERKQLQAMVGFIKSNSKLREALRIKNWAAAAREYNGPEYAKNKYDTKLAAAATRYSGK